MEKIVSNPYLLGGIAGFIGATCVFIDDKVIKKKESIDPMDYVKILVIIALLVIVSLMLYKKQPKLVKEAVVPEVAKVASEVVNNQIHTGNPNF